MTNIYSPWHAWYLDSISAYSFLRPKRHLTGIYRVLFITLPSVITVLMTRYTTIICTIYLLFISSCQSIGRELPTAAWARGTDIDVIGIVYELYTSTDIPVNIIYHVRESVKLSSVTRESALRDNLIPIDLNDNSDEVYYQYHQFTHFSLSTSIRIGYRQHLCWLRQTLDLYKYHYINSSPSLNKHELYNGTLADSWFLLSISSLWLPFLLQKDSHIEVANHQFQILRKDGQCEPHWMAIHYLEVDAHAVLWLKSILIPELYEWALLYPYRL